MRTNIVLCVILTSLISVNVICEDGADNYTSDLDTKIKTYLDDFFLEDYRLLDDNLIIDNEKFIIAAHVVDKNRVIVDHLIIIKIYKDNIEKCFSINKQIIYGEGGNIIFDTSVTGYDFFGWAFEILEDKETGNPMFKIDYYFNDEDYTDGIMIIWNTEKQMFEEYSPFDFSIMP